MLSLTRFVTSRFGFSAAIMAISGSDSWSVWKVSVELQIKETTVALLTVCVPQQATPNLAHYLFVFELNKEIRTSATTELHRVSSLSAPDECSRACCEEVPPRICYYHFTVEYYIVLGAAGRQKESSRLGRVRSRVVANQIETLKLQVATGIIRSRATTPTDNPALLDSIKGSKFRGEPPSSSSVNTRAGRRPSTHAAVEPSITNRPDRNGLVEALGAPGSGYGTPLTPGNHNNGGKGGNGGETGNEDGDMDRRLAHLERMLSGLTVTVTGMAEQQKSQLNQSQGSNGNALGNPTGSIPKEKPKLRVRRSASDWFFTFVDEMDNWETFEKLVRIRFGNPNQEQGIRSRIQGRKQHRNEKFIEFASDIERLNKQLSKPLSTNSKFQTLWQNMHSHYRTKIAPGTQIKSLKDLTEACQRIDAVDTSLNPSGEIAHQRMVNNVDVEESENDSEASADVNVVRTRQARDNRYTARRREQPEQEGERENVFRQQPPQHQRTERNQESSRLGRVRSRVVANQIETLKLQVATGIIRSRATTPTDNPALLDSIKGSKFRGEPPSSSSVNTRAGRRPSTHATVEPSITNRPDRNGLVEALVEAPPVRSSQHTRNWWTTLGAPWKPEEGRTRSYGSIPLSAIGEGQQEVRNKHSQAQQAHPNTCRTRAIVDLDRTSLTQQILGVVEAPPVRSSQHTRNWWTTLGAPWWLKDGRTRSYGSIPLSAIGEGQQEVRNKHSQAQQAHPNTCRTRAIVDLDRKSLTQQILGVVEAPPVRSSQHTRNWWTTLGAPWRLEEGRTRSYGSIPLSEI
ncbi:hypothetical protein pipiens_016016 [Culex pipiens pipiens]|uniref:Retrotransposon gag domain-containing protein n=1 Tax=Culex pipiens pipiens TaxID=38569 RepID=A0ABD1CN20_CULPP